MQRIMIISESDAVIFDEKVSEAIETAFKKLESDDLHPITDETYVKLRAELDDFKECPMLSSLLAFNLEKLVFLYRTDISVGIKYITDVQNQLKTYSPTA